MDTNSLLWAVGTALGAGIVLALESLAAREWNRTQRLKDRPWNYVAGCGTLLVFYAVWAAATGNLAGAAVYALHLVFGGAAVFGAYAYLARRESRRVRLVHRLPQEVPDGRR